MMQTVPQPASASESSLSSLPENIQSLTREAKVLFERSFPKDDGGDAENDIATSTLHVTTAPGRVNLIGEHVDYTGGFVLPMAIGKGTVCYGRGSVVASSSSSPTVCCRLVSSKSPSVVSFRGDGESLQPSKTSDDSSRKWADYVLGVVKEYLVDLNPNAEKGEIETLKFDLAIAGDVPLGGGLSSSASLEVAVATFLESILDKKYERNAAAVGSSSKARKIARAKRCQSAENNFCGVPCGIMDQFVSSSAVKGKALLIDCREVDFREVSLGGGQGGGDCNDDAPVIVITNSNVTHDLGAGEYPIRVQQCREATDALQKVNSDIQSLRDATLADIEAANIQGVTLRRARHVVTENARTVRAASALESGDWKEMGRLMNESHDSMRDDYEVSCEEIDILVDYAQNFEGVYGSRLTGGGFGGCTVTLVKKDRSKALMEGLTQHYSKSPTGDGSRRECSCFETLPGDGARSISFNDAR